jgi:hypothetical protein
MVAKYNLSVVETEAHKVITWLRSQKPKTKTRTGSSIDIDSRDDTKSHWETRPGVHLFLFTSGVGATVLPSWQNLVGRWVPA